MIPIVADASVGIEVYPVRATEVDDPYYRVTVSGVDVPVLKFAAIHYAHFSMGASAVLEVSVPEEISYHSLSPKRDGIPMDIRGNCARFMLESPRYLVLTLNGYGKLFLLADPAESDIPDLSKPDVVSIADYGIDGNGSRLETEKIQHAINDASAQSRTLYFPPGLYYTGTLNIPSHSKIYHAGGATIEGSLSSDDYPSDPGYEEQFTRLPKDQWSSNGEHLSHSRLLFINKAVDVRIWGRGTIDGNGLAVRKQGKPANLLRIQESKNVVIEGIILRDAAAWNTHILYSDNVQIRNVKIINNQTVRNTDGVNPDASTNITITDNFMYCGDDNVAVKSTNNNNLLQDCRDITVSNNVLLTKKSALKIGTETKANEFANIRFAGNDIVEADRGFSLYCMDGATLRNVTFENNWIESFIFNNHRKAMHFRIKNRTGKGRILGVQITDCAFLVDPPNGSVFSGYDASHMISNITFTNLRIGDRFIGSMAESGINADDFVEDITFWLNSDTSKNTLPK